MNVVVSHGGAITGRVFGLDGRPAVGAGAVALLKRLDRLGGGGDPPLPNGTPMMLPLGQTTTDAQGEFRLERLPSGDYLVAAQAGSDRRDGAATAIRTTYYPNTTEESAAQVVAARESAADDSRGPRAPRCVPARGARLVRAAAAAGAASSPRIGHVR